MLEKELDSHLARAGMEKLKKTLAPQADESMPTRPLDFPINVTVNQIPMNEFIYDSFGTDRIIGGDVFNGLIREHDPPSKGIVWLIPLVDLDLVFGISQLHADAQVESCGTTANTNHFHVSLTFVNRLSCCARSPFVGAIRQRDKASPRLDP